MDYDYSSSDSEAEDAIVMHSYDLLLNSFKHTVEAATSSDSVPKNRKYVYRDRVKAMEGLINDYFSPTKVYNEKRFKSMFRMRRPLFLRIVGDMEQNFDYFKQKSDARCYMGFTSLHKYTSAIQHLTFSTPHDCWDDYLKISEKCPRDTLYHFCDGSLIILRILFLIILIIDGYF